MFYLNGKWQVANAECILTKSSRRVSRCPFTVYRWLLVQVMEDICDHYSVQLNEMKVKSATALKKFQGFMFEFVAGSLDMQ